MTHLAPAPMKEFDVFLVNDDNTLTHATTIKAVSKYAAKETVKRLWEKTPNKDADFRIQPKAKGE